MVQRKARPKLARQTKARSTRRAAKPTQHVEVHYYKKELGKAPTEKTFVLRDGRKLATLYELIDELDTMSDDAFREYVSWERNDFANWINDVFEVPDLATELRRAQSRIDAQHAIMKHIIRELAKLSPPVEYKHRKQHAVAHPGAQCLL
ncbi:hypothetical protein HY490_04400 [Candidatus Woesearchaeota archaeon]|nr:hypothetical protein [Candidatus Woesearchaeota archaeon]